MQLKRRKKEYSFQAGRPYGEGEYVHLRITVLQNPTRKFNATMVQLVVDEFAERLMKEASEIYDD